MTRVSRFLIVWRLILWLFIRFSFIIMIITLGLYYGKLFEALLVLITFLQFELAYRQHWLSKVRDEPVFAIYISRVFDKRDVHINLENVGPTPAYLVGVSRILCKGMPLSPEQWESFIKSPRHSYLKPSAIGKLAIINQDFYEKYFEKRGCTLEVSYFNRYNEWRSFVVGFNRNLPIIINEREPPGFLLSIPEHISLLITYLKLRIFLKYI